MTAPPAASAQAPSQSYWALVWGQFKKNRLAFWSAIAIGVILLIAAWAPVLANGKPLIWVQNGKTTYPLIQFLVAPHDTVVLWRHFISLPATVDHLFNYFLLLSITAPIVLWPTLRAMKRSPFSEHARRRRLKLACLGAVVLATLPFISIGSRGRDTTAEERSANGDVERVSEWHLFRQWRLDERDYYEESKLLNREHGEWSLFPPIHWDPEAPTPATLLSPCPEHILGTDGQGRDVLSRMLHGARISMSVGFVAVGISTLIGILIGGLAGYYRGWVDLAISRFIELMICFPTFFLIITIIAFIEERSVFHIMLILGLTGWTGIARLIRGEFLKLADQDFVVSARALGCGGSRLMFRHILPNAMGPVFVSAAFGVAGAILTESGLSYLGFGAPPPTPTWGEMISQGKTYINEAWWLMLFPGLSIFLSVTVYNLAGDGLRDAMDPKMRR